MVNPNGNTIIGLSLLFIIGIALVFGSTYYIEFGEIYSLPQNKSGNMCNCKIDHQVLSNVKILSETHLLVKYVSGK